MIDTRIKICGITTPEDARLSHSLGADYLGLIFADGPRRVTLDSAVAIRSAVPGAMLVGVFVDAPVTEVVKTCQLGILNLVQLHGNESPEYCDTLVSLVSLPIIKAVQDRLPVDIKQLRKYRRPSYFLFDLDKNRRPTGNGANGAQEKLWSAAADIRRKGYRIFLAGSLNASNVKEALNRVKPYCIDVASGVEKAPGVKDPEALTAFFKEVRG